MNRFFALIFTFLVKCYKLVLSPLLPMACRYTPSCSEYMMECLRKYGPWKGGRMGIKRILRCRPGGGYGYDPVP